MQRHFTPFARIGAFLRSCFYWDKPFIRHLLWLCLPMILQDLMAASLHIVDGMMVSGLGDAAYSAVMQANRFTFLVQLFIFGIATGSAIFLSQYWGIRDISRMRHSMGLALVLSCLLSLFFSLVGILFPRQIIRLFLPPGESFELAVQYLRLVSPSYMLSAIGFVYAASLKAAEKTHLPMLSVSISLVIDTLLSYAMIYGLAGFPAMGVEGAAVGTIIGSAICMCLNLAFAYGKKLPAGAPLRDLICRDRAFIRKFIKTVVPVIFNEGLWALGVMMYSIFYGTMGDVSVSAVGVCTTVGDLMWVFIMAITNASAIMVGKTLGQGDKETAYLYGKRLLAGGVALGVLLGGLMIAFHTPLVGLFGGLSDAARSSAARLITIAALFLWLRSFNCINVVGLLRSGGDTVFSLVLDVGAMWCIGVPAVGIAALVLHWPIEYVYLCTLLDEVVKLIIGIPHFYHRKWMNILTDSKEVSHFGNA